MDFKFDLNMRLSLLIIMFAMFVSIARGQQVGSNPRFAANIPGAQTAIGMLASSANGVSRYLAPDGPIQPALTAIGGLPMRGIELANNGISQVSLELGNGAQGLSRFANNEAIRMPELDTLESAMPPSVTNLGGMIHGVIQQKNKFIMGQAEKGVQAGERLRSMMQNGLKGMGARSSGHMMGMANMINGAQESLMKGTSEIQKQFKETLNDHMSHLQGMQGIGDNMRYQMEGITRSLSNGLTGTIDHLHRTGEQVRGQIQVGLQQNTRAMSGIMSSMQGGMGKISQNMHKNLNGVIRHAQNAAQQVTNHIQQVVSGPVEMIQNLGNGLGSMMQSGSMGVQSKGRY